MPDLRGRSKQRGYKLDDDCYQAQISKHECGQSDKRIFCLGLIDMSTELPVEKCIQCKAYAYNAECGV